MTSATVVVGAVAATRQGATRVSDVTKSALPRSELMGQQSHRATSDKDY